MSGKSCLPFNSGLMMMSAGSNEYRLVRLFGVVNCTAIGFSFSHSRCEWVTLRACAWISSPDLGLPLLAAGLRLTLTVKKAVLPMMDTDTGIFKAFPAQQMPILKLTSFMGSGT